MPHTASATNTTGYVDNLINGFADITISGRPSGAAATPVNWDRTIPSVASQPPAWPVDHISQSQRGSRNPSVYHNDARSLQSASGTAYPSTYITQPTQSTSVAASKLSDTEILNQVSRKVVLDPGEADTPLDFPLKGERPHRMIKGTHGNMEKLDPSFQILSPSKFKRGFVFRVLWPELAGDSLQNITVPSTCHWKGEKIFCKIRWFVVVREGHYSSTCLSIQTYGGRGVPAQKPKHHHAIMYTGPNAPSATPSELCVGEPGLGAPIRVTPTKRYGSMDPFSRVNFVKVYTVEHNVKVESFGYVDRDEEWKLITQFNSHWNLATTNTLPIASQQNHPSSTMQDFRTLSRSLSYGESITPTVDI
ncbi:hypothetical protein NX059_005599 [Plenodomus lindquistii]|nr:hypothetical protein NX059_005599 [Plenodomus lindquistii]